MSVGEVWSGGMISARLAFHAEASSSFLGVEGIVRLLGHFSSRLQAVYIYNELVLIGRVASKSCAKTGLEGLDVG